jgi:hypothetical protein
LFQINQSNQFCWWNWISPNNAYICALRQKVGKIDPLPTEVLISRVMFVLVNFEKFSFGWMLEHKKIFRKNGSKFIKYKIQDLASKYPGIKQIWNILWVIYCDSSTSQAEKKLVEFSPKFFDLCASTYVLRFIPISRKQYLYCFCDVCKLRFIFI